MYKTLALVALLVKNTNAGGFANSYDPRVMWFRWAIPLGGGYGDYDDPKQQSTDGDRPGQSIRQCGVQVTPNSIRKCYWTDCFKSLHKKPWGARRRLGCNGKDCHYDEAQSKKCGIQRDGSRRRTAAIPADRHLAIQCESNTCQAPVDVKQFRYWKRGALAYKGLNNGTKFGKCPGGTQPGGDLGYDDETKRRDTDIAPPLSFQWYGTAAPEGGACIYGAPPSGCQCKTLVCRVSAHYTPGDSSGSSANWGNPGGAGNNDGEVPANDQLIDECNFIVRIEDAWSSPLVPKMWMWHIFSISGSISLLLTAFYYNKYGAELVKGHAGGEEGSEGEGN